MNSIWLHRIGWLGCVVFVGVVIVPMIVFFVLAACMEYLSTGNWQQSFDKSRAMGKHFEQVIWKIRSLGGRLPIQRPQN